jgi:hypothetical protein
MKIICFSSYTAVWRSALAEATIAWALQKKGNDIVYITPGGQFVGKSNLAQERILRKEFNLNGYELRDVLTRQDIKKISLILRRLTKDNFESLKIDGIDIGKIAMYEFLINHKKMDAKFTQKEWCDCINDLKDTLVSYLACREIVNKERPDRIVVYNETYSVNRVWDKYATLSGIPVYFMHHGMNFSDTDSTLIIAKTNSVDYRYRLLKIWSKVKHVPVPNKMLSYVTNNFFELLKAKHFLVYSSPKSNKRINIRNFFAIKDKQKVLTATMSSYDELFAGQYVGVWKTHERLVFTSQTEWIKALIDYVKSKGNLFLIIRVHPRDYPNKRDRLKSDHAKMLEKVLIKLPANVKVNWPTDNISIYDLAQETDVFLNAWSSVGVEMSLLGIPVVTYVKEYTLYPQDLNYVGKDRKDYFAKIDLALIEGWSYKKIKMTYRWLVLYYYRTVVKLRGEAKKGGQPILSKIAYEIARYLYSLLSPKTKAFMIKVYFMIPGLGVGRRQINDCRRQLAGYVDISPVERMLCKSADTLVDVNEALKANVTVKEEDRLIRNEIKRMYEGLYGNLPKGTKIKKNSLQYNLYKTFHR